VFKQAPRHDKYKTLEV